MFDVTVPKFNNMLTSPVLQWEIPVTATQAIQVINVGAKGAKIVNDMQNAEKK